MVVAEVYCLAFKNCGGELDESDYNQLLLDYFEMHGRSIHLVKYAIIKEVKSTGKHLSFARVSKFFSECFVFLDFFSHF